MEEAEERVEEAVDGKMSYRILILDLTQLLHASAHKLYTSQTSSMDVEGALKVPTLLEKLLTVDAC